MLGYTFEGVAMSENAYTQPSVESQTALDAVVASLLVGDE